MNYLSNARHSVLFWPALGLILALSIPLSLLAQQDNTASTAASLLVKTLGSIDYVEINTPTASAKSKQLIIFVHGTPGSYTAFRSYLNDPIMQDKFCLLYTSPSPRDRG